MSAYPTGHHAIAVKHARALADHYRAYDDTEDLVGVLVEMANIIDDLPEHDRQVAERAWDEGWADRHGLPENRVLLTRDGRARNPYRAAKGEQK